MPGTYSFFVEKVATASQVSYAGLTDDSGVSGNLVVKVGSGAFTVNLDSAGTDGTRRSRHARSRPRSTPRPVTRRW